MERERVTVVADGMVRLFALNGNGLDEYATIRANLGAEDAARLTVALNGFLEAADRSMAPNTTGLRVLPATARLGASPAVERSRPTGPLATKLVGYLAHHPGSTRHELATGVGLTVKQTGNALTLLRRRGIVVNRFGEWSLAQDEPALPVQPQKRRRAPSTPRPTSEHVAERYERIVAYLGEHPGTSRSNTADALGIDKATMGNAVARLVAAGKLRQEAIDPNNRHAGKALYLT